MFVCVVIPSVIHLYLYYTDLSNVRSCEFNLSNVRMCDRVNLLKSSPCDQISWKRTPNLSKENKILFVLLFISSFIKILPFSILSITHFYHLK